MIPINERFFARCWPVLSTWSRGGARARGTRADPANCVTAAPAHRCQLLSSPRTQLTNHPTIQPTNQPTIDRSIDRPIDGSISDGIADGSRDRASLRSPHWVVLMDRYLRGRCTLKECAPIAGRSSRDQIYLAAPRHASPSARSFVSRSTPDFLLADLFRGGDFFLWSPLLLFTRGSRNFFDGIEINFSFSFFLTDSFCTIPSIPAEIISIQVSRLQYFHAFHRLPVRTVNSQKSTL